MWFWWAVASSVVVAVSVVLTKKALNNVSASLLTWVLFSLNIPLVAWLAFSNGPTQVNQWFFFGAIGSASVFAVAKTLRLSGIKKGLLSRLAPLAAFNAVFTYILGLIILTEKINLIDLLGLLLVIIGAYTLNAKGVKRNIFEPFKLLLTEKSSSLFMLGVGITSFSAIFDKISITNTFPSNPSLTLLMENIVATLLLLVYLQKKKPNWKVELKENFWLLLANSLVYAISVILVFTAFATGPVALVIGVRQLQLFFILILSFLVFNDKPSRRSILASVIMVAGALLIKLT